MKTHILSPRKFCRNVLENTFLSFVIVTVAAIVELGACASILSEYGTKETYENLYIIVPGILDWIVLVFWFSSENPYQPSRSKRVLIILVLMPVKFATITVALIAGVTLFVYVAAFMKFQNQRLL